MLIQPLLLLLGSESVITSPSEVRLRKDLMRDYNPLERPVERSKDPVVVTLGVIFQQIIDLVQFSFSDSLGFSYVKYSFLLILSVLKFQHERWKCSGSSSYWSISLLIRVFLKKFQNEREEKLEINAWLKYNWKDMKLRWDPLEYGNIRDLRHPAGSIWQPDILLYNRYAIAVLQFHHSSLD